MSLANLPAVLPAGRPPRRPGAPRTSPRAASRRALGIVGAALGAALAPCTARAQLAVLRTSAAAALDFEPGRRFPTPAFVGDLSRGYGSTEDARAWNLTLRGLVQLRSRSGRTALVGQLGHEMTANPYNSGGLNPRGAAWEEDLHVVHRVRSVDVRAGIFYRCRHEVDSATPLDERPGADASRIGTRIILNKGVEVGVTSRDVVIAPRTHLRLTASVDRFFAREDWRIPESAAGPHWKYARGRVASTVRVAYAATRTVMPYARGWVSTTLFEPGADTAYATHGTGGRLEAGVRMGGTGGLADVFVAGERYFDDMANPVPQRSRVVAVGVRLGSGAFF